MAAKSVIAGVSVFPIVVNGKYVKKAKMIELPPTPFAYF